MEEVSAVPQAEEKPLRCLMQMRDENFRPLIRRVADVLALIEKERLVVIGDLRVRGSILRLGGINGVLARVEGETAEERFAVAIPFVTGLSGIDGRKTRRKYPISWLPDAVILPDGSMRLRQFPNPVRAVEFEAAVLPYDWTETRCNLSILFSRYANENGLAEAALGSKLPLDYSDFEDMAKIEIISLTRYLQYVSAHWHEISSDPTVPSRETISATLAALSVRGRSRGRNARRRVSAAK